VFISTGLMLSAPGLIHPYQQPVHQQFSTNATTHLYFLADVPHLLKNIGVNIIIVRTLSILLLCVNEELKGSHDHVPVA